MADTRVFVQQDSLNAAAEGSYTAWKGNKLGYGVVMDFYTQMALEGRVFQVRAGTITVPIAGDIALTDAAAEMCADAASGTTIMPVSLAVTLEVLGGDALEMAAKSVATVSSAGAAFVPLNLKSDGVAATSTARAATAGGVTVTVELATTTLRHWESHAEFVSDSGAEVLNVTNPALWEPRTPPVLVGPRCFYVQIASATAGPFYMAHFDYIELPTANIS